MDTEAQHTGSAGALLRIKDAACMLRVSSRTIWRMIAEHQLTAVRIRRCTRVIATEVRKCGRIGNEVSSL